MTNATPTNALSLPTELVHDLVAALGGNGALDFDAEDLATLLAPGGRAAVSFGISLDRDDTEAAVNAAWPYPAAETQNVDALVVVRGGSIDVTRYKLIQNALELKMEGTGTLLASVQPSKALPRGVALIVIIAIARDPR